MRPIVFIAFFSLSPAQLLAGGADIPAGKDGSLYEPKPLAVRSEAVGQLFRLNPVAHDAALDPGQRSFFSLSHTVANLWGKDPDHYRIDAEFVDEGFRAGFLVLDGLRLDLGISQRRFASTGTDALAIGFHNLFGLHQDGRLDAERNNLRVSVPKYNINFTRDDRNLVFSQQYEIGLTWDLGSYLGFPLGFSVYGSQEAARGNPYFTGAVDYGWQLNSVVPMEDWALYATLSHAIFDKDSEVPLETFYQQWGWTFGGAYRFLGRSEILLQAMVTQPLYRGVGQLSRNSYEWHLGYRYRWGAVTLEATLIENVIWSYNSPDWGYTLAVRYDR